MSKIIAVPTNIITGFLGVGKTTAIQHLLQHKPQHERWAVLVNEFGEVGIDGSLFAGQSLEQEGVFIREVPGGCMCCSSGLPMQVALNMLLTRAKPDRLLIEPTGLGHPKEVLKVLTAEHYREVLKLQASIALVDARNITDSRYTEHETFNQQLEVADIIVANKVDLYQSSERDDLAGYLKAQQWFNDKKLYFTSRGELALEWLALASGYSPPSAETAGGHQHSIAVGRPSIGEQEIPEVGFLAVENRGEGYVSIGWRFSPEKVFDRQKVFSFLSAVDAERAKGIFITEEGVFAYNQTRDALTEIEIDDCLDSRIELIAETTQPNWETEILACQVS